MLTELAVLPDLPILSCFPDGAVFKLLFIIAFCDKPDFFPNKRKQVRQDGKHDLAASTHFQLKTRFMIANLTNKTVEIRGTVPNI